MNGMNLNIKCIRCGDKNKIEVKMFNEKDMTILTGHYCSWNCLAIHIADQKK